VVVRLGTEITGHGVGWGKNAHEWNGSGEKIHGDGVWMDLLYPYILSGLPYHFYLSPSTRV